MQVPRIEKVQQTTNDTPTVVEAIVMPQNKGMTVKVEWNALKSTKDQVAGGTTIANFYRTTGNVSRTSNSISQGLNENMTGNFPGPNPYIDIVANTGAQTIDVTAVGKSATTIDWIIKYHYILQ